MVIIVNNTAVPVDMSSKSQVSLSAVNLTLNGGIQNLRYSLFV